MYLITLMYWGQQQTQQQRDMTLSNLDLEALTPETYTDYAELSYRYDGNNVDIDTENAILAKNEIKYNGIIDSINKDFSNLKLVMK